MRLALAPSQRPERPVSPDRERAGGRFARVDALSRITYIVFFVLFPARPGALAPGGPTLAPGAGIPITYRLDSRSTLPC